MNGSIIAGIARNVVGFVDGDGDAVPEGWVFPGDDLVEFDDGTRADMLELTGVERERVAGVLAAARDGRPGAVYARRMQSATDDWSDAEMVDRLGVDPRLVWWMRRGLGWSLEALSALLDCVGTREVLGA